MNKFYWMVIGLLLGLVNLRAEIKLPALVSDNARAFRMRGTSYTHGFAVRGTLRNDEGIYFNLGGKYASLTFKTGMKDGKYTARKPAKVTIKADGKSGFRRPRPVSKSNS